MKNIILFDGTERGQLLPFTFTRPVGDMRIGILTIKEKWEKHTNANVSFATQDYLSTKFSTIKADENLYINGAVCPSKNLCEEVLQLKIGQSLYDNNTIVAFVAELDYIYDENNIPVSDKVSCKSTDFIHLQNLTDIFTKNDAAIKQDFELLTAGRTSANINNTNRLYNDSQIFAEESAIIESSILNAKTGPIYIGNHAEVMEGSIIRGAFALCDHAGTKLATKVYGATTVGPYCKIGGEVNNVVMWGFSNKGHDGFLGNAVIGEWCNIGADTNNSNLKNNYAPVKLWSYITEKFENTGQTFCGLMMADHAKCGINTMFNTGTVVGVAANIFGAGFPRNYIPSFAWGGAQGFDTFQLPKVYEMATIMASRRGIEFSDIDKDILKHLFEGGKQSRFWEK